ncbi:MAG TPA: hypothetical protein VKW06_00055 [Candidatus Angelobacter sp.]|nr:hypothetical protein [Candidatus Angelobacter sp.]
MQRAKEATRTTILEAIRELARQLGRAPTRAEFTRRSGISHFRVQAHFASLRDAVREAGLAPNPQGLRIASAELLRDWARVAWKLKCAPSRSQYLRHGRYSAGVFTLRFGSWTAVAEAFRRFAREHDGDKGWTEVLPLLQDGGRHAASAEAPGPCDFRIAITDLDSTVRRGSATSLPTASSMAGERCGGAPLPPPLEGRRCITQNILALMVNTLAPQPGFDHGASLLDPEISRRPDSWMAWPAASRPFYRGRPVLGAPLILPGLAYEPVNESGVVFLFGMLAHRLGFRVECLQAGFPDCEATRQVQPGRWQRVRIEFEYESRNFLTHRHPATECDVIVCWRHNWADCPAELEVVELRAVLAGGL